ncbi:hypothetical protein [Frigoriflavimonas asaccharolytica]|uniref:Carboxypeptidase-like protein n=1 Tax=Frigoriflavimonas asaccharolytica TaxID=2735899 RepID=A0A8J8K9B5_9FLAO|nr:hypothetical protein [Frigoriflavimonas asaccharolytica]NRS93663.1 hypothetical protein [Frigoriflavimonas asaccharolytica]
MKTTLFFVFLFLIQTKTAAQEYVFGKVLSEDQRELKGVSIINISNQQTAISDDDGNFMIFAKVGDEIRFTKERYNRNSVKINATNISKSFLIRLEIIPYDIEEVEIKYKITGDVNKDANHFGKSEKILKFDDDMAKYIRKKSSPEVMAPQKGDFVQTVGPGFSVGKISSQWDDIDLSRDFREFFTDEFFVNELKLKVAEIPTFIFYVLRNFERKNITKYGVCSGSDYARFREEAFRKIVDYKKNIPNDSKKNGNKLQLKDKNTQNGLWWN